MHVATALQLSRHGHMLSEHSVTRCVACYNSSAGGVGDFSPTQAGPAYLRCMPPCGVMQSWRRMAAAHVSGDLGGQVILPRHYLCGLSDEIRSMLLVDIDFSPPTWSKCNQSTHGGAAYNSLYGDVQRLVQCAPLAEMVGLLYV